MSHLVSRFTQRGLVALSIAAGRGGKPTYTSAQQTRILAEVQRKPDHKEDQTGIWSLMTLRRALRKSGTVLVYDRETPGKKDESSWRASTPRPPGSCNSLKMKPGHSRPFRSPEPPGNQKAILRLNHMSMSHGARPNSSPSFVRPLLRCAPKAYSKLRKPCCIPGFKNK